jgi:hypothetical protein
MPKRPPPLNPCVPPQPEAEARKRVLAAYDSQFEDFNDNDANDWLAPTPTPLPILTTSHGILSLRLKPLRLRNDGPLRGHVSFQVA